jgi:hypothetical protein
VVADDRLGPHRTELSRHPGPELLQAHPSTLTRPGNPTAPRLVGVIPSTGSTGWDVVVQIAIALALLTTLVLLVKNYRDRDH